jgi:hypothetical protein
VVKIGGQMSDEDDDVDYHYNPSLGERILENDRRVAAEAVMSYAEQKRCMGCPAKGVARIHGLQIGKSGLLCMDCFDKSRKPLPAMPAAPAETVEIYTVKTSRKDRPVRRPCTTAGLFDSEGKCVYAATGTDASEALEVLAYLIDRDRFTTHVAKTKARAAAVAKARLEEAAARNAPPPMGLFTVALYDSEGCIKLYNAVAETREQAEAKALAYYRSVWPDRVYTVGT